MLAKIIPSSICIFLTFTLALSLQANDIFDEFKAAILNQAPKIKVEELCRKYNGKGLDGRAYIVSIGSDTEGNFLVSLSTKKNPASLDTVNIVVFLRKYFVGKKLRVKAGDYVRFIGNLQEIRMSTIILNEGVVKY